MRIINSDGSEAEMCGNASRCVPLYLLQKGFTQKKQITLETLAGPIQTEVLDEKNGQVRVNMGTPRYTRGAVPMEGPAAETAINIPLQVAGQTFIGTGISMGNPHFVVLADEVEKFPVEKWGPLIETHPCFPQKTNVEFVQIVNSRTVRMRVWERGVGITQACGTGACATAAACILNGLTETCVTVCLDGGKLQIEWPAKKEIWMTGPAARVFEGDIL